LTDFEGNLVPFPADTDGTIPIPIIYFAVVIHFPELQFYTPTLIPCVATRPHALPEVALLAQQMES